MILSVKCCIIAIVLTAFVNFSTQNAVPSSSRTPGDVARDYCKINGWKPAVKSQNKELNIKGPHAAEVGQFPMMAAIFSVTKGENRTKSQYVCSGSLISDKFVVTGAPCVRRIRYVDSYFVRLGRTSIDLADDNDTSSALDVAFNLDSVAIHPNYDQLNNKYDDIALIPLGNAVKFTDFIKPICLDVIDRNENRKFIKAAYGKTYDSSTFSNWLKYADVREYDHDKCTKKFDAFLQGNLRKSQLCAKAEIDENGNAADFRHGDGGAPLIFYNEEDGTAKLTGITSFGYQGENSSEYPIVYTKISSYIGWIESVVWPEQ